MTIPTVNVIIGFKQEVMEQLFALKGHSYEGILNSVSNIDKEKTTFLLNNGTGSNLLSLRHQFNYSSESNSIKIEFVDPTNDFERRILANEELPAFLMKELTLLVGKTLPDTTLIDKVNEQVDIAKLNKIYKEFLEVNKDHLETNIYLAYGVGNNLRTWHGPSKWKIITIDINVGAKGSRQFTIEIAPLLTGITSAYRFDIFHTPFSKFSVWEESVHALSPEIVFFETTQTPLPETKKVTILSVDYHTSVKECIRDYVRKYTRKSNVIVLLPDLNQILSKLIDQENKRFNLKQPEYLITKNYIEELNPFKLKNVAAAFESLKEISSKLGFSLISDIPFLDYEKPKSKEKIELPPTEKSNTPDIDTYVQNTIKLLSTLLLEPEMASGAKIILVIPQKNLIGYKKPFIALGKQNLENENETTIVLPNGKQDVIPSSWASPLSPQSEEAKDILKKALQSTPIELADKVKENFISSPSIQSHMDREVINPFAEYLKFLSASFKLSLYSGMEENEQYLNSEKLFNVFDNIKKYAIDSYIFDSVVMYENDLDIINVWKKYESHPLLSGNDGIISSEEDCVVVVGDKTLIRNFLYGEFDISTPEDIINSPEFKKSFPVEKEDQKLLFSPEYNKDISEVVLLKGTEDNGFGAISNIPEEFAFKDTEDQQNDIRELARRRGIPVFRYNTSESNVTDLRILNSKAYFAALTVGMDKSVGARLHKSINEIIPEKYKMLGDVTLGSVLGSINQKWATVGLENVKGNKQEIIKDIISQSGPFMWEQIDSIKLEKFAELVYLLFYLQLQTKQSNYNPIISLDQFVNNNPLNVFYDFIEDAYSNTILMSVTTLPFFHLSNCYFITSQLCLLYAQDIPIMQTLPKETEIINRFYSGVYRIAGFEHIISNSEVKSSFKLVRAGALRHSVSPKSETASFEYKDTN